MDTSGSKGCYLVQRWIGNLLLDSHKPDLQYRDLKMPMISGGSFHFVSAKANSNHRKNGKGDALLKDLQLRNRKCRGVPKR